MELKRSLVPLAVHFLLILLVYLCLYQFFGDGLAMVDVLVSEMRLSFFLFGGERRSILVSLVELGIEF